jgi:hypothetical protein
LPTKAGITQQDETGKGKVKFAVITPVVTYNSVGEPSYKKNNAFPAPAKYCAAPCCAGPDFATPFLKYLWPNKFHKIQ